MWEADNTDYGNLARLSGNGPKSLQIVLHLHIFRQLRFKCRDVTPAHRHIHTPIPSYSHSCLRAMELKKIFVKREKVSRKKKKKKKKTRKKVKSSCSTYIITQGFKTSCTINKTANVYCKNKQQKTHTKNTASKGDQLHYNTHAFSTCTLSKEQNKYA